MKVKKILALGVAAATLGGVFGAGFTTAQTASIPDLSIDNSIIVLPTVSEVDGVPVHVKEDAVAGARLALALYKEALEKTEATETKEVIVEHKSLDIADSDNLFILGSWVMPDHPEVLDNPNITTMFHFDKISFNVTEDGAMEIVFDSNKTAPAVEIKFAPGDSPIGGDLQDRLLVQATADNETYLYLYDKDIQDDFDAHYIGEVQEIGDWDVKYVDYDIDAGKALVQFSFGGEDKLVIVYKDKFYVGYQDETEGLTILEFANETDARNELLTLQEQGVDDILMITLGDSFFGVKGTQMVYSKYEHYTFYKAIQEDSAIDESGLWKIDWTVVGNDVVEVRVYLDAADYHVPGDEGLTLPFSDAVIKFKTKWDESYDADNDGVIDPNEIQGVFVWEEPISIEFTYDKYTMPDIDPYSAVIPDYELSEGMIGGENIIIIGGWVSNQAWALLENIYGEEKVQEWKDDVMDEDGKALVFEPIPGDEEHYVIIAAGKDYEKTAEAVSELITMLAEE